MSTNGTKTPPDARPPAPPAPPAPRMMPTGRMPLNVLNLAPLLTHADNPEEFVRSLDMLLELAPGVLMEPQYLIWHPALMRYVYRAPNGGIVELERIERALKLGYDDSSRDFGIPDGQHLTADLDPARWQEIELPSNDPTWEPSCRWQRYEPLMGSMLYVFELIDRTVGPHAASTNNSSIDGMFRSKSVSPPASHSELSTLRSPCTYWTVKPSALSSSPAMYKAAQQPPSSSKYRGSRTVVVSGGGSARAAEGAPISPAVPAAVRPARKVRRF